ncbi:MAG TPA: adenylate/guanylate cyclase domain-containing protein [Vicinamibacterales bacterium]
MFTFIYREDDRWERRPLPSGDSILGRATSSDLVLRHPSVSRRHALVHVEGDVCHITDLGSRLGTCVNGEPVQSATLRDGDVLTLGQLTIKVQRTQGSFVVSDTSDPWPDNATIVRPAGLPGLARPAAGGAASHADRLLPLLAEATGALARTRDLSQILDRVLDLTFDIIPAEQAFLLLVDEASGDLVPRAARTRDGRPPATTEVSRTVTRTVMAEKTAMLTADVKHDPRLDGSKSLAIQKVRSFMCAPLWTGQDVFGILYVDTPTTLMFSPADLDLFVTVANYAAVAIDQARLAARLLEETKRRERLQRYHSPAVAARIINGTDAADTILEAHERDVSVLFADIVGFTTLSETLPPSEVAALLNTYFTAMTDVIFEHEGTLDKFIGDGVLAVFGAPLSQPDHAVRAVRAAADMRETLQRLNARDLPRPVRMRLAVNSGRALVGDIGAPRRRDFTVLGDVVNTASRLQASICKPDQILVSESTYRMAEGAIEARPLGSVTVKGRSEPVTIYEI